MKKIILVLTMIFTIFSCGSSSKSEKDQKVLILNLEQEGSTLDLTLINENSSSTISDNVNEGLIKIDKEGNFVNGLAKEIKESEDGLTYTITLRDNLKWSNGDPITVDDFIYSWTRALDPKTASPYAYMLYPIKNAEEFNSGKAKASDLGLEKINDKEFIVKLERFTPYFNELLGFTTYYPLNEKFVKEQGESYALEPENLISSGAFIIKDWIHGTEIVLEKNPNYYDAKNIKVDKVIIKFISDSLSSLNAFKNGEIHETQLSTEQYNSEFSDADNVIKVPRAGTSYFMINTNGKVLSNKNIRKALVSAIDNDTRINKVFKSITQKVGTTFTPEGVGIKGVKKDFVTELKEKRFRPNEYNVEEAKKYLAKGLKELGLEELPPITVISSDTVANKDLLQYIQEELRKNLGITLKIELMTFKEKLSRQENQNFDMVIAGWGADILDPINFLELLYSKNGNNDSKYNNPEYDELIEKAYNETNRAKRFEYLGRAEQIIADEVPIIVLTQQQRIYAYNENIENLLYVGYGPRYVFKYVDIK